MVSLRVLVVRVVWWPPYKTGDRRRQRLLRRSWNPFFSILKLSPSGTQILFFETPTPSTAKIRLISTGNVLIATTAAYSSSSSPSQTNNNDGGRGGRRRVIFSLLVPLCSSCTTIRVSLEETTRFLKDNRCRRFHTAICHTSSCNRGYCR